MGFAVCSYSQLLCFKRQSARTVSCYMPWKTVCSHSQLLCLERQSAHTLSCYALNDSSQSVAMPWMTVSLQSVAMPWTTVCSHSQLLCLEWQSVCSQLLCLERQSVCSQLLCLERQSACSQLLCLERQSARTVSCYALNEKVIIPWRTCDENFAAESLGTKSWEHHLKRKFLVKGSSCIMRIPGYCTSFILCTSTMPCTHPSVIPCTYIYIHTHLKYLPVMPSLLLVRKLNTRWSDACISIAIIRRTKQQSTVHTHHGNIAC